MKALWQIILGSGFVIILLIPGYTFFKNNSHPFELYTLFRLFGLYGFTLIWAQLIIGPFMTPLRRVFGPKILDWHRSEGLFAFIFATIHPAILGLAYYLSTKDLRLWHALSNYLPGNLYLYGLLGPAAWTLLVVTITTALLRTKAWFNRFWRYFHFLNYLLFVLIFLHSYKIGSDTKVEPLQSLYFIFAITFCVSVLYRIAYRRIWQLWFKPKAV